MKELEEKVELKKIGRRRWRSSSYDDRVMFTREWTFQKLSESIVSFFLIFEIQFSKNVSHEVKFFPRLTLQYHLCSLFCFRL